MKLTDFRDLTQFGGYLCHLGVVMRKF